MNKAIEPLKPCEHYNPKSDRPIKLCENCHHLRKGKCKAGAILGEKEKEKNH